jgi:hypothetical protein
MTNPEAATPRQLLGRGDVDELAALPIDVLEKLQTAVAEAKERAKHYDDLLTAALIKRFATAAAAARAAAGKKHGVVHLEEGGFDIACTLGADVKWDQAAVAKAVAQLKRMELDPGDFVKIEYKISETKYAAWNGRILGLFKPARTVKDRKPGFEIKPVKVEQWKEAAREAA